VNDKVASVTVERRPLSELRAHPRNPRVHPEAGTEEWEKLRASLARDYFDPLVWNRRNGLLVSGHLRGRLLADLGFTHADVVVVDYDEPTHLARLIAANRLAGKDDRSALAVIVEELHVGALDLSLTGLRDIDLAKLLPESENPPAPEPTEPPAVPLSAPGDVYLLGPHRLICGEARSHPDVQRVLAGDVVDQLLTDPPYGIDYVAKVAALDVAAGRAVKPHSAILNDNLKDYRTFFTEFLAAVPLAPKNTVYVFMSGQELHSLRLAFDAAGLTWSDYLLWVKNGQVLGRKDYHPKHEFIVYGWRGTHRFYGGASAAVFDDEVPPDKMSKAALAAEVARLREWRSSVLREDKTARNDLHPTIKPVNLVRRLVLDGSAVGAVVFDSFTGSGTTLIACDQTGRRFRGIEGEPGYCDVIVRRYLAQGARAVRRVRGDVESDVTADFLHGAEPAHA